MLKTCWLRFVVITVMVALSLLAVGQWLSADKDSDLLELVQAGCHQAVANATSGKGNVTVRQSVMTSPDGQVYETETAYKLAFDQNNWRLSTNTTTLRNDQRPDIDPKLMRPVGNIVQMEISVKNADVTLLEKEDNRSRATKGSSTSKTASRLLSTMVSDVQPGVGRLGKGLVDIGRLGTNEVPLFSKVTMRVIGREVVAGSECIVVEEEALPSSSDRPTSTTLFWVDPQKGYAVPKVQVFVEGGPFSERTLVEEENAQLKEYKPGIWYPTKITADHYSTKDPAKHFKKSTKVITYDPQFQINVPVDAEDLSLVLPSGTSVYDENLDASYKVP